MHQLLFKARLVHTFWYEVTNVSTKPAASIFYPEDRGNMFLRNARTHLPDHTASVTQMTIKQILRTVNVL